MAVIAGSAFGGLDGLIGSALGCGLVLINVFLLVKSIKKSRPGRLAKSIWWTVLYFNIDFLLTIAACVAVMALHLGSPVAFLGGLFVFFLSLVITVISAALSGALKTNQGKAIKISPDVYSEFRKADLKPEDILDDRRPNDPPPSVH
jgi:hypothetical protein